jgi:hypothetical protein
MPEVYAIGDIHGHYQKMLRLLRRAHLIDTSDNWTGADATLVFVGDYVDRGPDGFAVVDFVMRLEQQAAAAGGQIVALLGNHDALIVAADRFGSLPVRGQRLTFIQDWRSVGGVEADREQLTAEHYAWLAKRPALALVGERLFIHADALFYAEYGTSIEMVNRHIAALLAGSDSRAWTRLLDQFAARRAFSARDRYGRPHPDGISRAQTFLRLFGGRQIVHGHTPIPTFAGIEPDQVHTPFVYAENLCVNVDGGLYMGSPGFVCRLPAAQP